jgi:septal ring factor EnvC (AmiA/AmiB activator)
MVESNSGKKENQGIIKTFLVNHYRDIILIFLGLLLVYLLIRAFTPAPDKSELLKYKLEQLDKKIEDTKKQQLKLDSNIVKYREDIKKIDKTVEYIRNQKTIINNYYTIKEKEINGYNYKQIDSSFKKRYGY